MCVCVGARVRACVRGWWVSMTRARARPCAGAQGRRRLGYARCIFWFVCGTHRTLSNKLPFSAGVQGRRRLGYARAAGPQGRARRAGGARAASSFHTHTRTHTHAPRGRGAGPGRRPWPWRWRRRRPRAPEHTRTHKHARTHARAHPPTHTTHTHSTVLTWRYYTYDMAYIWLYTLWHYCLYVMALLCVRFGVINRHNGDRPTAASAPRNAFMRCEGPAPVSRARV